MQAGIREVIVNIRLERIDIQEGVTVEVLLDSSIIGLVKISEFAKKQRFKLKKIERSIYIRNVDRINTVEVNIFYEGHRERTEINVIDKQK